MIKVKTKIKDMHFKICRNTKVSYRFKRYANKKQVIDFRRRIAQISNQAKATKGIKAKILIKGDDIKRCIVV